MKIPFFQALLIILSLKLILGFSSNYEVTTFERFMVDNDLIYFKVSDSSVLNINGPSNVFVCMTVCTKLNECRSFYLESGACVFGVTQIVNGIENTDLTTVRPKQKIYVKGDMCCGFILFTV